MKSVAIVLNPEKTDAIDLARSLVTWLQERNVLVMVEHDAARAIDMPSLSRDEKELATADFAVVMGGDGTLLRANRVFGPAGVPMLPIRFGKFGFLAEAEPSEAYDAISKILDGDYQINERMMLEAVVTRSNKRVSTATALNDMVIAKGPLARMLRLELHVSGKYVANYAADGLIIASPTGSTAYSLSAGGPLVTPDLRLIIITPICPHTLSERSLIVSDKQSVDVVVESDSGDVVMLTVDGQLGISLEPGDRVSVRESKCKAKLLSVDGTSFFEKLQTLLKWGDRLDI